MKKSSSSKQSPKWVAKAFRIQRSITIRMDLGDKHSGYCVLDGQGEVIQEGSVGTSKKAMAKVFGSMSRCRIAIEVSTHSPWVSRLLRTFGHEVVVANPRQVKLISASSRKDDRLDAQTLARLARVDPQLLRPIQHRSAKAQGDLMVIRVRAALVEARTQPGEHRTGTGEIARRTIADRRYRPDGSRANGVAPCGIATSARTTAEANGLLDGEDQGK